MVSFRSSKSQAELTVRQLELKSQGTERNYEQALRGVAEYMTEHRLGDLRQLSPDIATAYLEQRAQEVGQKTLDMDRQAMQAAMGEKLAVIKSEREQALTSRAYTHEQAERISQAQSDRHALATQIAENAGLRAHELYTLQLSSERPADTHREYRVDLHAGRADVVTYTVEGKGGLCREVAIDRELAEKLEATRLAEPGTVYDRGIAYTQNYDIGGGQNWSQSFSEASERALGWSEGAHGLRHEYAQERMNVLQGNGYTYREALEVVSQEMGHFRPDITEVYLR